MPWTAGVLAPLLSIVTFSGTPCKIDGALEELAPRGDVSMRPKQEVDGVASAVDRPVQILPLTGDFDVGFIHAPAQADRALALSKRRSQDRQDLDRPAVDGGLIDEDAALGHHLLDVTKAQRIGGVPACADQHHFHGVVQPFEKLLRRKINGLRASHRNAHMRQPLIAQKRGAQDLLSAGRKTHLERISHWVRRLYGLCGASASKRRSVSSSQARMSFFALR